MQSEEDRRHQKEELQARAQAELDAQRHELAEERLAHQAQYKEMERRLEAAFLEKEKTLRDDSFVREAQMKEEVAKKEEVYRKSYEAALAQEKSALGQRHQELERLMRDKGGRDLAQLQDAWATRAH